MSTDTLELVNLDELLNNEPRCQSAHYVTTCSGHVTHLGRTCSGKRTLICDSSAEWAHDAMTAGDACAFCKQPAADCWQIIPI